MTSSKKSTFTVTVLGSGTSQGVPVIGCECSVCQSEDWHDKRLRSAILMTIKNKNYVIDTGPDFRQQMLREKIKEVEAILFTHQHKDHLAGLDDVRAFNFRQQKKMTVYCNKDVEQAIKREFYYIFEATTHPGIPQIDLRQIDKNTPVQIHGDAPIYPIEVMHYKLPVLGFRYRNFTYITDAKTIDPQEKKKIKGTKVLIVNALRKEKHISHFNLEEALSLVEEIQPETTYLTHVSHLMGKYKDVQAELPKGVQFAYDGLRIELDDF